jgi:hypothetical protein
MRAGPEKWKAWDANASEFLRRAWWRGVEWVGWGVVSVKTVNHTSRNSGVAGVTLQSLPQAGVVMSFAENGIGQTRRFRRDPQPSRCSAAPSAEGYFIVCPLRVPRGVLGIRTQPAPQSFRICTHRRRRPLCRDGVVMAVINDKRPCRVPTLVGRAEGPGSLTRSLAMLVKFDF